MVDATKECEAYFRAVIEHVELGKRRMLEQFAQSLHDWLDDLLNHPIPDTWPQELARFVAHTAYYGLDIEPRSIRAIAELIRAKKAGAWRAGPAQPGEADFAVRNPAAPTESATNRKLMAAQPHLRPSGPSASSPPSPNRPASGYDALRTNPRAFLPPESCAGGALLDRAEPAA